MNEGPTQALIVSGLALYLLVVLFWIESLNHQAGGVLPMEEPHGKWRTGPTTQEMWTKLIGPRKLDGTPIEDDETWEEVLGRERANRDLRTIVGSLGLFQFPLSLAVFLWAGVIWWRTKVYLHRVLAIASVLAAVAAFLTASLRGYSAALA